MIVHIHSVLKSVLNCQIEQMHMTNVFAFNADSLRNVGKLTLIKIFSLNWHFATMADFVWMGL